VVRNGLGLHLKSSFGIRKLIHGIWMMDKSHKRIKLQIKEDLLMLG
jgi:hypothetical protein